MSVIVTKSQKRTLWITCDLNSTLGKELVGNGSPYYEGSKVRIIQVMELRQDAKYDIIIEFEYVD